MTKSNTKLQSQLLRYYPPKNTKMIKFIEKHCKWLQIQNLPIILSVGYIVFFFLIFGQAVKNESVDLYGQGIWEDKEYWRAFTFVFIVHTTPIWLYFVVTTQWMFGTALEQTYGSIRFTLFFFTAILVALGASYLTPDVHFNDSFSECVFFSFAILYPDFVIRLFFIIPIKIKWLALIGWIIIFSNIIISQGSGESIANALVIILPMSLFFGKEFYYKIKYKARKTIITAKKQVASKKHHHQCLVCDATDITDPKKEFRYMEENGQLKCFCDAHAPIKKN